MIVSDLIIIHHKLAYVRPPGRHLASLLSLLKKKKKNSGRRCTELICFYSRSFRVGCQAGLTCWQITENLCDLLTAPIYISRAGVNVMGEGRRGWKEGQYMGKWALPMEGFDLCPPRVGLWQCPPLTHPLFHSHLTAPVEVQVLLVLTPCYCRFFEFPESETDCCHNDFCRQNRQGQSILCTDKSCGSCSTSKISEITEEKPIEMLAFSFFFFARETIIS